jgi:nucleotide-binding universal stress UspA family protein
LGSLPRYRRVLVATDLSNLGNAAIPHALALLGPSGGTLVLCHVLERFQLPNPLYAHYGREKALTPLERKALRQALEKELRTLADRYRVRRKVRMVCRVIEARASVDDAILRVSKAEGIDAIVLASHGRSGIKRMLLGSTVDRVLRASRVPVLVVRGPRPAFLLVRSTPARTGLRLVAGSRTFRRRASCEESGRGS